MWGAGSRRGWGGGCGQESRAQAGGQAAERDAVVVKSPDLSFCLPKSLQESGRAGLGDVDPPHSCPGRLCIPPGGLPCLLPVLPAQTFNPRAAGAAQLPTVQPGCQRPLPPGSGQKWVPTRIFCFCCTTTACYGA